jgi:hypothetical protein
MAAQCFGDLVHKRLLSFTHGLPPKLEAPIFPFHGTDVREAKEVERLGLPFTAFGSTLGSKAAELDQAGFLWMKVKCELGKSLSKVA